MGLQGRFKFKLGAVSLMSLLVAVAAVDAHALEYNRGRYGLKLTGYGTAGALTPKSQDTVFVGDWRVRGQANYAVASGQTLGLVYSIDELAVYQGNPAREAFVFAEDRSLGRVEVGFTSSIAGKLGIALPDVGGLRLNDDPLFYKKIPPAGAVISNTSLSSSKSVVRVNFASVPTRPIQYGFSIAGLSNKYKYAFDFGMKYRRPYGKLKSAFSFGASFIDSPEDFKTDIFTRAATADWRAQMSAGLNLQYNSWIWGVSGRVIYDQDPVLPATDGVVFGTGISYDFLKYSISASYLFSDTGIWDDTKDYMAHTGLLSLRYKYSKYLDVWMSGGITTGTPFISAGLRVTF